MMGIGERIRTLETTESADMVPVTANPNGSITAAEGVFAWDYVNDVMYVNIDGAMAWTAFVTGLTRTEKSWSFFSPSGSAGDFYFAGFYEFGASHNDFSPAINFGTANAAKGAHFFVVTGAVPGAPVTIRVTGTSITDSGVRTAGDTEDIVIPAATPINSYFEWKKWIGQIAISVVAGTPFNCNYGFAKYWANGNTDFIVTGLDATWIGGANDNSANIRLHHHRVTGWTFNLGSPPTPPPEIAGMQTDYVAEINIANGENGAWKRTNLNTAVSGSGSEGVLLQVHTSANGAFEQGNFLLTIKSN